MKIFLASQVEEREKLHTHLSGGYISCISFEALAAAEDESQFHVIFCPWLQVCDFHTIVYKIFSWNDV